MKPRTKGPTSSHSGLRTTFPPASAKPHLFPSRTPAHFSSGKCCISSKRQASTSFPDLSIIPHFSARRTNAKLELVSRGDLPALLKALKGVHPMTIIEDSVPLAVELRRDEDGKVAPLPHDLAGYFDFSTDLAQEVRQDMVDALEAFGISVEAAHHEVAAGQHEIDFEYSDALRTADNAITFKFALKAIAQQHGLYATFMPKPIFGINGSGMHTHQSLYSIDLKRNAFADPESKYGLSDIARSYMAGILAHAKGMIAVLAPTVNSYKRLVPGYEAPTYITWGRTNRSALIRVPMISPGKSIEGTRAEVRCPDPSSNAYLAFAVMIAAGLDGGEKGMVLSDPVEESLFEMDATRVAEKGISELPGTLGDAIDEMEKDPVVCEALGEHVLGHFIDAKRAEWDGYRAQVTQWEIDRYLEAY